MTHCNGYISTKQLNIPGLQRVCERACIACGSRADLFCARCAVTPYCGEPCQRKDWISRHSAVCHNLTRLNSGRGPRSTSPVEPVDDNSNAPAPVAPLRRPRSPLRNGNLSNNNNNKGSVESPRDRGLDRPTHYSNSNKTMFVPQGHRAPPRAPRAPARPAQDDAEEDWADKKIEQKPTQKNRLGALNMNSPKPQQDTVTTFEKPKPNVDTQLKETPTAERAKPQETSTPKPNAGTPRMSLTGLVPSQYLVEKLPIGESFVLSVEQETGACASRQVGFVCLAMHSRYEEQFNNLLGEIYDGQRAIVPKPGATFAYFEPSDQGWYRARCLNATKCALLDGSRVADITPQSVCRALAPEYADIPEFCCVLDGKAELNMSLKCTILMRTTEGYKVSIDSATEDSYLGEGLITRWVPEVESQQTSKPASIQDRLKQDRIEPTPTPEKLPQTAPEAKSQAIPEAKPQEKTLKPSVPEIPRPDVINNGKYLLLHVTSLARACVRACDDETTAEFESVLQDTALYGIQGAKRLTTPPLPGQEVLCQYEGVHYRALVTRTKTSENRYKVQYVEYGNEEVVPLEKLYSSPPSLSLESRAASASLVSLSLSHAASPLSSPATLYINSIKEEAELLLTIPTGEKRAPSGSLVTLIVAKNKENVNKKLEEMCTPEWKKLEEAGGDVIESDVILFSSMSTLQLPTSRQFTLSVTDFTCLERGVVSGFEHGVTLPDHVYGPLTDRINEYCNSPLCSDPYLPMVEEVCLAKLDPYPQWFRAVVVSHRPGAATAAVLYVDYGNMSESVPVTDLRKCMPEFARDPALAATAEIKGWPKAVNSSQLLKAIEYLQIDEEGRGRLPVARATFLDQDMTYVVEAPGLLAAISE